MKKSRLKRNKPLRAQTCKKKPATPKTDQQKRSGRESTAKPKKPTEKALRAKLDKIAGDWFRRDAVCVACGEGSFDCNPVIQWCHVVRRGCRLIRHDPRNAIPMCKSHHVYFTHRPELWHTFIERLYPGRLQFLVDLDRSRAGMRLVDVYESYEKWFKGRTDCFRTWDGKVE